MRQKPIISLCIATNGMNGWVFSTLDSIFCQGVEEELFEVIVADNGGDVGFQHSMIQYAKLHKNLIYKRNHSKMFYNQLEAVKLGSGAFLKFINHRDVLLDGSLAYMLDIVGKNIEKKPVLYFSNRILKIGDYYECDSFDKFVRTLGIYVSHTSGVGIWKEQYDKIKSNLVVDSISPHSCLLFSDRNNPQYIIIDKKLSSEITYSQKNKGVYDLFKAFAVEEPSIVVKLYIDGDICVETLKSVLRGYRHFVANCYFKYCIQKEDCSYILEGFEDSLGVYFSKKEIFNEIKKIKRKKKIQNFKKYIRKIVFFWKTNN